MKKFFSTVIVGVIVLMIFSLNSYSADDSIDFSNAKVELFQ